jgi:DNA-binding beta-propeller fold protein YncE
LDSVKPWAGLIPGIVSLLPVPAALGAVVLLGACGGCDVSVKTTALPPVAGIPPAFDAVEIDQAAQRLYVADRTRTGVDVIDVSTASPRFLQTVDLGGPPSGLALAPDSKRLYASVATGSLAAIDTDPASKDFMKVTDRVSVGKRADLIDYGGKHVYVGSGSSVVFVDTTTNKVSGQIDLKTSVEQPRFNSTDGMLYVTSADSVIQIDPDKAQITKTYGLTGCKAKGLAINPSRQLALVACTVTATAVDLRSGAHWEAAPLSEGDVVSYHPGADRFLEATSFGPTTSVVAMFSGDAKFISSAHTDPRGHAAAYDAVNQIVYTTGAAGILSFHPAACAPGIDWKRMLATVAVYVSPFALLALVLIAYARYRAKNPRQPELQSRRPEEEDYQFQRERMRDFENSILGADTVAAEDTSRQHDPWGGFLNST